MGLRQNLETGATTILSLCALAVTVSLVRREYFPPAPPAPPRLVPVEQADWRDYAVSEMRIGPTTAPVTFTVFSDFECPACRTLYRRLESIRSRYGDSVTIAYRNYPLDDLHPAARPAAIAAECAARHGRFLPYYKYLFENQDSLRGANWSLIAHRSGITDTASFRACLAEPSIAERLRLDSVAASRLGIPGTPLVLVNEHKYRGAPSQATLDSVVGALVGGTRRVAARSAGAP